MAVTGKVEIYNMALTHLGADRVQNTSGTDERTVLLNLFYSPLLDKALRMQEWGFAIERQALAADTGDNYTPYTYKYQLPVDPYCVKPLCLLDTSYAEITRDQFPYTIEGRFLYSDVVSAILKYVGRPSAVSDQDSDFVMFFSAYLATMIAYRLTGDREVEAKMHALTNKFYAEAVGNNQADVINDDPEDLWTEAGGIT
jgi:hypothetical protein